MCGMGTKQGFTNSSDYSVLAISAGIKGYKSILDDNLCIDVH